MTIRIKRVYANPDAEDGVRILVDRLWPRGMSREKAHIDLWLKEIAPSTELRKWFGHDPARWEVFRDRYLLEIRDNSAPVAQILKMMRNGTVTLVYGARDVEHNEAAVLLDFLAVEQRNTLSLQNG